MCACGSWLMSTPGLSRPCRIDELLDAHHDVVRRAAPLRFDERRHVAAGAVLRLERAVVLADDHRDEVVVESLVLPDRRVASLNDCEMHEMQVPVLRVPEDDRRRRSGACGRAPGGRGPRGRGRCPVRRCPRRSRWCPVVASRQPTGTCPFVPSRGGPAAYGSLVNSGAATSVSCRVTSAARDCSTSSSVPATPWNSTRMPAASVASVASSAGTPGIFSTERSAARSISSIAAAPASVSGRTASAAVSMSRKKSRPVYLTGRSGTVWSTPSARNARVPSEPISRWRRISSGVSKSRNALSE